MAIFNSYVSLPEGMWWGEWRSFRPEAWPRIHGRKWLGDVPESVPADAPPWPWFLKETDRNWGTSRLVRPHWMIGRLMAACTSHQTSFVYLYVPFIPLVSLYIILYIYIIIYVYIYIIHILLYTVYSRGISIFPRYFHRIPMAWRWRARCPLPLRSRWVPGERQRRCDLCGPKAYPWPTAVHKWGEMPHQAARTSWFWMILWIWELVKIMI